MKKLQQTRKKLYTLAKAVKEQEVRTTDISRPLRSHIQGH